MSSIIDNVAWAVVMAARVAVAHGTAIAFRAVSAALRVAPQQPAWPVVASPRVPWRPDMAPPRAGSVSSACSSTPGSSVSADSSEASSCRTVEAAEAEASAPSEGFPGFTILSVGEQLGAGAFGKVEAVKIQMDDGTIRDAVMKTIYDHISELAYDNEVKALEAARGVPYVVQMYGACKMADRCCIVLERVYGVSLSKHLLKAVEERGKRRRTLMSYAQIAKLAHELLSAVRGLHARGFAHNDLKSDNLMLREGSGELCLVDLGNASWTDSEGHLLAPGGTLGYMCKEAVAAVYRPGDSFPHKATLSSDLFSCGVVLACAAEYGIMTSDVRCLLDYQIRMPVSWPDDMADLIFGLAHDEPGMRYTVHDAVAHPFVTRMVAS